MKVLLIICMIISTNLIAKANGYSEYEKGNIAKAITLLIAECNQGNMISCSNLGILYSNGKVPINMAKSTMYYKKSCHLGNANACLTTAYRHLKGQGARYSKSLAKEYNGKACDLGNNEGCKRFSMFELAGY